MSTQSLTDFMPQLRKFGKRTFQRKLRQFNRSVQKSARRTTRRISRAASNWYNAQYFLGTAARDARKGIRANEDIFLAVIIFAVALAYAAATVTAEMLYVFFETAYAVAEAFDISMISLSAITLAVLGTSLAWVGAFALTSMSTSIMHGLTGKKQRSLRGTLRHGLRYTTRTTTAWFLVGSIIAAPIMLAAMLGMSLLKFGTADMMTALTVTPYVIIAGITWIIYCLMQYSMVPYIAIFEPQLSFSQTFARSHQLVQRKGRIFLLSMFMAIVAGIAGVSGLSFVLENQFHIDQSVTVTFGSALVLMAANALMVAFYRKRRLARVN